MESVTASKKQNRHYEVQTARVDFWVDLPERIMSLTQRPLKTEVPAQAVNYSFILSSLISSLSHLLSLFIFTPGLASLLYSKLAHHKYDDFVGKESKLNETVGS